MSQDKPPADACPAQDPTQESRIALRESFLHRLLPVLRKIFEQGTSLTMSERLRAIKSATVKSLASTSGSVSWSRALSKRTFLQWRNFKRFNRRGPEHCLCRRQATSESFIRNKYARTDINPGDLNLGIPARRPRASNFCHSRACRNLSSLRKLKRKRLTPFRQQLRGNTTYLRALRSFHPRFSQHQTSRRRGAGPVVTDSQITSLRGLIPGGDTMDVPMLLKGIADYIISLRFQVDALEFLAGVASM